MNQPAQVIARILPAFWGAVRPAAETHGFFEAADRLDVAGGASVLKIARFSGPSARSFTWSSG
jgi:hypothetical protein